MHLNRFLLLLFPALMLAMAGCDDFLDINTDPNKATQAPVTGLMAQATFQTAYNHQRVGNATSYFVQYLASPNPSAATDVHDEVSYDEAWARLYDVMTDLTDLVALAEAQDAVSYRGAARVMMAVNLGMMVDLWGSVPYSDAFLGQTLSPAFDAEEELYQELHRLLDAGIADLQAGTTSIRIGQDDYMYRGDVGKWLKTAHFLKARYLNHLTKQASYNPVAVLAALDHAYASNDDDAEVAFFEQRVNPWAEIAINNADRLLGGWISSQLVEAMSGVTYPAVDPRLPFMFGTTSAGTYVGTDNGAGRGDAPELGARSTLVTTSFYAARTAPIPVATYAEQKFIEAEAAFRAGQRGRSYQAYLGGIRAHMDKLGVAAPARDAYLADASVAVGDGNLTLDLIFKEKYVAMFLHPEAWVDARRFDYGYKNMTLPANHNPVLAGRFIRRLAYPNSEVTRNRRNVPPTSLGERIFWDR